MDKSILNGLKKTQNGTQLAKLDKIIKTETYGMYQEAIIEMKTRQDGKKRGGNAAKWKGSKYKQT